MARSLQQRRRAGDLPALKIEVWMALLTAAEILADPESAPELKLRCVHAIAQTGGVYMNLLKVSDFEQRLAAVEEAVRLSRRNGSLPPGRNGRHATT
jgi:hypothetical protein